MTNNNQNTYLFWLIGWLFLLLGGAFAGCSREPPASDQPKQAASSVLPCSGVLPPELYTANADQLFSGERLPVFDIYLPETRWNSLLKHAADEQYTEAEVCYESQRIGKVGLRFKGAHGTLFNCIDEQGNVSCPRLSMKLKFNKYDKKLRFFGLKRLNFNTNRFDDSHMREKLAYDLYRAMGIKAPRAYWAKVRVNGKSYGLYGMVEQVDSVFVKERWPEYPDANLYKEIWPTQANAKVITGGLKTNSKNPDVSNFIEFSNAINRASGHEQVLAALQAYSDLDYWAKYLAVDEAILSYDGITYFFTDDGSVGSNHNFLMYESGLKHFSIIPWDVESTFWINPDHAPPHWTVTPSDCRKTYPYWGGLALAPGCDPVLQALSSDRTRWHAAMQELLDGAFSEAVMYQKIDRYKALIGEAARAEETPQRNTSFDQATMYLRMIIPQLRNRMEAFIAEEGALKEK